MVTPRKHTVVIVTGDSIARVDLSREKSLRVKRVECAPRGANAALLQSVTDALRLGPRGCGKLWVLADEFWSGKVSLASDVVSALDTPQLEQAIALEAEFDSGISPFASRLSYVAAQPLTEGQITWQVTQAETQQIDALTTLATTWAGKLAGVATPPTSTRDPFSSAEPARDAGSLQESSTTDLGELAQLWLSDILSSSTPLPVIRPLAVGWSQRQQWRLGIAVACVVLALCGADYRYVHRRLAEFTTNIEETARATAQLKSQLNEYEAQSRQLQADTQQQAKTLEADQRLRLEGRRRSNQWQAMREQPVAILETLAATAEASHWLTGIELSEDRALIQGLAVSSPAVADLVQHLEPELIRESWRVLPSEVSALETSPVVSFSLTLLPNQRDSALPVSRQEANPDVH